MRDDPNAVATKRYAHFFATNIAVAAPGLARMVMEGAASVTDAAATALGD